jgi:hypothetical protein
MEMISEERQAVCNATVNAVLYWAFLNLAERHLISQRKEGKLS